MKESSQTQAYANHVSGYEKYLTCRWKWEALLSKLYVQKTFREMKLDTFLKTKKSECRLIRKIKKTFKTQTPILFMGDWSRNSTMNFKGLAPMPGVGLRRRLSRDCLVLDVNEAWTSQTCSKCLTCPMNVPIRKDLEVRGLRKCANTLNCGVFWNRDVNGSVNILQNGFWYLQKREWLMSQITQNQTKGFFCLDQQSATCDHGPTETFAELEGQLV